jgi:hypothetical protein
MEATAIRAAMMCRTRRKRERKAEPKADKEDEDLAS